jgi:hypothetical protein
MRVRCLFSGMVVLIVFMLISSLAISDEVENLLQGGDFEDQTDLSKWLVNNWNAASTQELDYDTFVTGEASVYFVITLTSGWDPRFYQNDFVVKEGTTYTFSAFLKAEAPYALLMRLHVSGTWDLFMENQVNVTTEWAEYWVTGSPAQDMTVQISICNTNGIMNYWIDNVMFYEGEYVPTELDGLDQQVTAPGKLATTWAGIKIL